MDEVNRIFFYMGRLNTIHLNILWFELLALSTGGERKLVFSFGA